ncbi:S24 family peptidase [Asticcacaulis sp. ZE23SCel15]|uniref:S24 family peptidase n=1 Tax=Asticcacaulis sp. ZE23SCel15 TaxID=3059027 RepID=UPI00265F9E40|nr:S24 family peptidase [Asticcacaulis sp. ZE23SCel15]WKL57264.1 S24 family peptidase [Asticcacaulis sp. ZE23SCel15]
MSNTTPRAIAFKSWRRLNKQSTKAVASAANIPYTSLASFVQGRTQNISAAMEQKIADAYGCAIEDIFVSPKEKARGINNDIPIIGRAAASVTHGYYINEYPDGGHPILPAWPAESVAIDVDGDSMEPRFYDGERLVFGAQTPDPSPYVGREVLAYLGDADGRTLIKILERNKLSGGWNLRSYNPRHETLEDVHIEWIRPFEGMRAI